MIFSRKVITFTLFIFILIFGGCKSLPKEEDEGSRPHAASKIPDDGFIRLVLNEKTGGFSLYFLSDPKMTSYEPFFNADEPLASFLSVNVDGKVYRLGGTKQFQTKIGRVNGDPALIFESSFIRVTQIFKPVKTTGSTVINGIMITIRVHNVSNHKSAVGLRMLLDTTLGEGRKKVPFLTNTQVVTSEVLLEGNSDDKFWISRGGKISLMGSIVNPVKVSGKGPDLVHIANWKRLNEAPWKLNYLKGRSFNNMPHSIADSAICYYFGPEIVDRDKTLAFTVFLTTEDLSWYNLSAPPPHITDPSAAALKNQTTTEKPIESAVQKSETEINAVNAASLYFVESGINITIIEEQAYYEAAQINGNADTIILIKLKEILNLFIEGEIYLTEQDLMEIEQAIDRHKFRN